MKYKGYEITSCFDRGVERWNKAENRNEICEGYFCEVYAADDDQYANKLDDFCLAVGYEIPDLSEAALEAGIRHYMDEYF